MDFLHSAVAVMAIFAVQLCAEWEHSTWDFYAQKTIHLRIGSANPIPIKPTTFTKTNVAPSIVFRNDDEFVIQSETKGTSLFTLKPLALKEKWQSDTAVAVLNESSYVTSMGECLLMANTNEYDVFRKILLRANSEPVVFARRSLDQRFLAATFLDATLMIIDTHTVRAFQKNVKTDLHYYAFLPLGFSFDSKIIAVNTAEPEIQLYRWRNQEWRREEGDLSHKHRIFSFAWSPIAYQLITGSVHGNILVWKRGKTRWHRAQKLSGHQQPVYALAFHPSGTIFASASGDGVINIWRADKTGFQHFDSLKNAYDYIGALAFSPDGTHLVVLAGDEKVSVWHNPMLNIATATKNARKL